MAKTFKTGPVNPLKPMELDDGTPVEFLSMGDDSVSVWLPKGSRYERSGLPSEKRNWWAYDLDTGIWSGGSAEEFLVLRNVKPRRGRKGVSPPAPTGSSLSEDDATRNEIPMFDGLLAYFPNALAEVARISKVGNDQHNPGQPLHWARGKSTDHENKIIRHLVDAGKLDSRGERHTARVAWRALALLQEELERDLGLPMSRGSKPSDG